MRYLVGALSAAAACVVLVVLAGNTSVWVVVVAGLGMSAALVHVTRCRHPHPALQPSTVDHLGRRNPTQWYCDDCGRSWPAVFEHDSAPVQRFTGFDPTKAVNAARRAEHLERQRRELARARAGTVVARRRRHVPAPVPIESHRLVR